MVKILDRSDQIGLTICRAGSSPPPGNEERV
jgi:hypothetical protein